MSSAEAGTSTSIFGDDSTPGNQRPSIIPTLSTTYPSLLSESLHDDRSGYLPWQMQYPSGAFDYERHASDTDLLLPLDHGGIDVELNLVIITLDYLE